MSSLDRILPFLKPIEDLLLDPTVTEVMVNDGGRRVFVERDGGAARRCPTARWNRGISPSRSRTSRARAATRSPTSQPLLDARLEDGSRVAAMFPPCAVGGTGADDSEVHAPLQPRRPRRASAR